MNNELVDETDLEYGSVIIELAYKNSSPSVGQNKLNSK